MPFDPNEAAFHRVQGLGHRPEDVRNLILTHMHFDHCGVAIKTSSGWFFHAGDAGAVGNDKAPAWLIRWALGPHDPLLRAFMKSHSEVIVANSHMYPEFFEQHQTMD